MSEDAFRKFSLFPKTLSACVEPLTRPALKAQGLAGSKILTEWPAIVGKELAQHTMPERLNFPQGKKTDGTLVISTENGFATHVQHMQPVILERLASYFGYQAVKRITISHGWVPDVVKTEKIAMKASLPKGSYALTDGVEDDELRETLASLARTLSGESV